MSNHLHVHPHYNINNRPLCSALRASPAHPQCPKVLHSTKILPTSPSTSEMDTTKGGVWGGLILGGWVTSVHQLFLILGTQSSSWHMGGLWRTLRVYTDGLFPALRPSVSPRVCLDGRCQLTDGGSQRSTDRGRWLTDGICTRWSMPTGTLMGSDGRWEPNADAVSLTERGSVPQQARSPAFCSSSYPPPRCPLLLHVCAAVHQ